MNGKSLIAAALVIHTILIVSVSMLWAPRNPSNGPTVVNDPRRSKHSDHGMLRNDDGPSTYYEWGPEGISLGEVLRYINVTYYDNITWSKPARSYQPFPAYIVVRNNTPSLWFPRRILQKMNGGAAKRLAIILPHFQHALKVQLSQHKERFLALVSALMEFGSIPLLFDLSDYHGCPSPTYHPTDERYKSAVNVPLFTLCRSPRCRYAFPIPTYSTYEYTEIGEINGTNRWKEKMDEWTQEYPWNKKRSQVYWKGGCKTERYDFIRKANNESLRRFLDVRSVGNRCGKGSDAPRKAAPDPPEFSMTYKAVFDIDGNSWSERLPRLLCYNSAVVLVTLEDDYEEYFMMDLIPNVHFIPASLENFTEVARTILRKENDDMLQRIVQNANAWCREHMTAERLNLDFLSVLNGYVDMLNVGNDQWVEEWKTLRHHYVGPSIGGFSNQIQAEDSGREDLLSAPT